MERIHRSKIFDNEWRNTSFVRFDGKEEYREKPRYRDRHAIFEKDAEWAPTTFDNYA